MALTALGMHTYFGGMQLGAERAGAKILGSIETWAPAIRARKAAGCHYCSVQEARARRGQVDVMFANPPCSRFSSSAGSTYTSKEGSRSDLKNFGELAEVFGAAIDSDARVLWWETGPLLWRKGLEMAASVQAALEAVWEEPATTVVMKYDPRWSGVPQRRPRCHVMHFRGELLPPESVPPSKWPIKEGLWEWVEGQLERPWQEGKPIIHQEWDGKQDPAVFAAWWRDLESKYGGFVQSSPCTFWDDDPYSMAVLSGRAACWGDQARWVTVEEWAAIMRMPQQWARAVADEMNPGIALAMLSKGVCPDAASFAFNSVIEPVLAGSKRPGSQFVMTGPRFWQCDFSVQDRKRAA